MNSSSLEARRPVAPRSARRGVVLVLVLAAIALLAVAVTLVARRLMLDRRSGNTALAAAQAESVWVTSAELFRQIGGGTELQFSLPAPGAAQAPLGDDNGNGSGSRTATARARETVIGVDGDEVVAWEVEVEIAQNGRVLARRRGLIPAQPTPNTATQNRATQNRAAESTGADTEPSRSEGDSE